MTNTVASLNLNTPCNNHGQNSSAATNHGISFQKTTTAMSTATISNGNNVSEMKTIGGVEGGQESFNNKHHKKKPRSRPQRKELHTTTTKTEPQYSTPSLNIELTLANKSNEEVTSKIKQIAPIMKYQQT